MANLGVTGGIGAGIMQGLQFMRQREGDARQEQALQNQSAMVDIHKQDQAFKMQEQDRKGRMLKGYQTIMAEMRTAIEAGTLTDWASGFARDRSSGQ